MRDVVEVLRRRWAWAVVGMLLAVGSAIGAATASAATHTYSASVLLLPPEISQVVDPSSPDYTRSNPLFFLGTLGQARDILVGALSSKNVQGAVDEAHPGVSYEASADVLGTGPIVVITAEGPDAEQTSQALDLLLASTEEQLSALQDDLGVGSDAQITSHVLTRDTTATIGHKDQVRSGLVVGGVVALVVLFAIGIGDALLGRRRRSQDGQPAERRAEDLEGASG